MSVVFLCAGRLTFSLGNMYDQFAFDPFVLTYVALLFVRRSVGPRPIFKLSPVSVAFVLSTEYFP